MLRKGSFFNLNNWSYIRFLNLIKTNFSSPNNNGIEDEGSYFNISILSN